MTEQFMNIGKSLPWRSDAVERAINMDATGNSTLAPLLVLLYKWHLMRPFVQRLCRRVEGNLMFSKSWRRILLQYHGVEVGAYSYGDVLRPKVLPPGTKVGRYCSTGKELIIRRRDHPIKRAIMHPAFYNQRLGLLKHDAMPDRSQNPLTVGHDVWIGDRVTILSGCSNIGNGAVLAAGSVVTRDVPSYSIVGGVPAHQIRMRFTDACILKIEKSEWWTKSLAEAIQYSVDVFEEASDSVESLDAHPQRHHRRRKDAGSHHCKN